MTVTVHSPPPVTTGTPFPCPGAGTTARSAKENLNDAERAVVLRSELGIALKVAAMLELHPDRDNPRVVWHNAREAVKKRQEA